MCVQMCKDGEYICLLGYVVVLWKLSVCAVFVKRDYLEMCRYWVRRQSANNYDVGVEVLLSRWTLS